MKSNHSTVLTLEQAAKKGASRLKILQDIASVISTKNPISICTLPGISWILDQVLIKSGFKLKISDGIEKDHHTYIKSKTCMEQLSKLHKTTTWNLFEGTDTKFFTKHHFSKQGYSFIWLDWMGTFTKAYATMLMFIAQNVLDVFSEVLSHNKDGVLTVVFSRKATNPAIEAALIDAFKRQGLTIPDFKETGTENAYLYRLQGVSLLLNQYAQSKAFFIPISFSYYRSNGGKRDKAMLVASFRVTKEQPTKLPLLYSCTEINE